MTHHPLQISHLSSRKFDHVIIKHRLSLLRYIHETVESIGAESACVRERALGEILEKVWSRKIFKKIFEWENFFK